MTVNEDICARRRQAALEGVSEAGFAARLAEAVALAAAEGIG